MFSVHRTLRLPSQIEALAAAARAEGFAAVDRLAGDYRSGRNRFALPGEALFEARECGALLGVGGLNIDPFVRSADTGRLRRLYVHPDHRGRGIGRALVQAIEAHARGRFRRLRLFSPAPAADRFYRALGYHPITGGTRVSHGKVLDR